MNTRYELIVAWLLLVANFDLLFMCFTEFKYWITIAYLKSVAPQYMVDEAENKRKEASSNVSSIQFGFAYLILGLVLLFSVLNGVIGWTDVGVVLLSVIVLHYSGNEDLVYFLLNVLYDIIPSWWWSERKDKILRLPFGRKLPKELPFLYEEKRIIGNITIKPRMIRLFGGKDVRLAGLIASAATGWIIIAILNYCL